MYSLVTHWEEEPVKAKRKTRKTTKSQQPEESTGISGNPKKRARKLPQKKTLSAVTSDESEVPAVKKTDVKLRSTSVEDREQAGTEDDTDKPKYTLHSFIWGVCYRPTVLFFVFRVNYILFFIAGKIETNLNYRQPQMRYTIYLLSCFALLDK